MSAEHEPQTAIMMARGAVFILPTFVAIAGLIAMHEPTQSSAGIVLFVLAGICAAGGLIAWPLLSMADSSTKR